MKLHHYQERALDFAIKKRSSLCLMDMGLGKTAVALKFIEFINRPALVLGPLQPIYNTWPEEIEKWTPNLTYTILHGKEKAQRFYLKKQINLLNYDGLKWYYTQCLKSLSPLRKHILIMDESSAVKDPSSIRFQLLKKLQPILLPVRLLLTATPIDEGLLHLWPQMFLLDGGKRLGNSYYSFKKQYFVESGPPRYVTHALPHSREKITEKVKDKCFRLEAADYVKMPEIISNAIPVRLEPTILKQYKKLEEDFVHAFTEEDIAVARSQNTLVNKLRQFVSGALYLPDRTYRVVHTQKAQALRDVVGALGERQVLVSINFKFEVDMIRKELGNVPVLHGDTPFDKRKGIIARWNNKELPVLLVHPQSVGLGMNLQSGGHTIIWYTLPWGLGPYKQLIGRLARQGQQSERVIVHHLLVKDTIDYVVMRVLLRKDILQEEFLSTLKEVMLK